MALDGRVNASLPIGCVDFYDRLVWFLNYLTVGRHGEKQGHCKDVGEGELHDGWGSMCGGNECRLEMNGMSK